MPQTIPGGNPGGQPPGWGKAPPTPTGLPNRQPNLNYNFYDSDQGRHVYDQNWRYLRTDPRESPQFNPVTGDQGPPSLSGWGGNGPTATVAPGPMRSSFAAPMTTQGGGGQTGWANYSSSAGGGVENPWSDPPILGGNMGRGFGGGGFPPGSGGGNIYPGGRPAPTGGGGSGGGLIGGGGSGGHGGHSYSYTGPGNVYGNMQPGGTNLAYFTGSYYDPSLRSWVAYAQGGEGSGKN